jgi:hypothetical protein
MSAARKRRARLTGGENDGERWRGWVRATVAGNMVESAEATAARLVAEAEVICGLDRHAGLILAAAEVRSMARELGELARLLADSARHEV